MRESDRDVRVFLAAVAILSAIFWAMIIAAGHVGGGEGNYVAGLMWSPALAAFATVAWRRLDPGVLGLGRWNGRMALAGYFIPLGYAFVAYLIVWLTGLGGFADAASVAALAKRMGWTFAAPALVVTLYVLLFATAGMVQSMAYALGEEIGWRGFLVPKLAARFGPTAAAFISGSIWAAWHLPILLFADYNAGTPWWFAFPCFAILVIAAAFILTWLRLSSASVWPCAIFHASHNLFIQAVFTPLTATRGALTPYAIDEFGAALPIVATVFALVIWKRRRIANE